MSWLPKCVCGADTVASDWTPFPVCPVGCAPHRAGVRLFFDTPPEARFSTCERVVVESVEELMKLTGESHNGV